MLVSAGGCQEVPSDASAFPFQGPGRVDVWLPAKIPVRIRVSVSCGACQCKCQILLLLLLAFLVDRLSCPHHHHHQHRTHPATLDCQPPPALLWWPWRVTLARRGPLLPLPPSPRGTRSGEARAQVTPGQRRSQVRLPRLPDSPKVYASLVKTKGGDRY